MEVRDENLRTEYSALANYFGTVVTFRFTTVGFFLAAAGLIVQAEMTRGTAVLLFTLTLGVWIIEFRNRAIFRALLDRAIQIEDGWGFEGNHQFTPLFRRLIRIGLWNEARKATGKEPCPRLPRDKVKIFIWEFPLPEFISHSLGLDIIYGGVLAFAIRKVWQLKAWEAFIP